MSRSLVSYFKVWYYTPSRCLSNDKLFEPRNKKLSCVANRYFNLYNDPTNQQSLNCRRIRVLKQKLYKKTFWDKNDRNNKSRSNRKFDWIGSSFLYIVRISYLTVCQEIGVFSDPFGSTNSIFLFIVILTTQMKCQNLIIRQCRL